MIKSPPKTFNKIKFFIRLKFVIEIVFNSVIVSVDFKDISNIFEYMFKFMFVFRYLKNT